MLKASPSAIEGVLVLSHRHWIPQGFNSAANRNTVILATAARIHITYANTFSHPLALCLFQRLAVSSPFNSCQKVIGAVPLRHVSVKVWHTLNLILSCRLAIYIW
jgi:hypothetical protein